MDKEYAPEEINRFEMGLDILARLEAEYRSLHGEEAPERTSSNRASIPIHGNGNGTKKMAAGMSLSDLLAMFAPLPPCSVLVGACEDERPVIIDLNNPSAGSILIAGDPGSGKTNLLLAFLASVSATNPARKVRFTCISPHLEELSPVTGAPHCYRAAAPSAQSTGESISELASLAEKRQQVSQPGNPVILAIDDLAELVTMLDAGCLEKLQWLVENGAVYQVWTVATLDTRKAASQHIPLLDSFGAWLVGNIDPDQAGPNLAKEMVEAASDLAPGVQFTAYFDDAWVQFWAPTVNQF